MKMEVKSLDPGPLILSNLLPSLPVSYGICSHNIQYSWFLFLVVNITAQVLVKWLEESDFIIYIWQFLAERSITSAETFDPLIAVFPLAVTMFYSPSNLCGTGGMRSEHIRAVNSWRGGSTLYDCVFTTHDLSSAPPANMRDLHVACVTLLFSFSHHNTIYQCTLVCSLSFQGDKPDEDTGMWIVEHLQNVVSQVIPLNSIYCAAHLILVYHGVETLPWTLTLDNSLDHFGHYYVNKFADHHAFKIIHHPSL